MVLCLSGCMWLSGFMWLKVATSGEEWIKVDKGGDFMWLSGFMCERWRKVGKSKEKW